MDLQSDVIWDFLVVKSTPDYNNCFSTSKNDFADILVENGSDEVTSFSDESVEFSELLSEYDNGLTLSETHLSFDPSWIEEKMSFPMDLQSFDEFQSFEFPELDEVSESLEDTKVFENPHLVKEIHSRPNQHHGVVSLKISPLSKDALFDDKFQVKEDLLSVPSSPEQFVPASPTINSSPLSSFLTEYNGLPIFLPSKNLESVQPTVGAQNLLESLMVETSSNSDVVMQNSHTATHVLDTLQSYSQSTSPVTDDLDALKPCSQSTPPIADYLESLKPTPQSTPKKSVKSKRKVHQKTLDESILHKKKPCKEVRFLEPSERKKRKMGQNKTAAHRYREKKRIEFDEIKNIENDLEYENTNLTDKVNKLESEIIYLKRLLREALVTKGLLKNTQ